MVCLFESNEEKVSLQMILAFLLVPTAYLQLDTTKWFLVLVKHLHTLQHLKLTLPINHEEYTGFK